MKISECEVIVKCKKYTRWKHRGTPTLFMRQPTHPLMRVVLHNCNYLHVICMAPFKGVKTVVKNIVRNEELYICGGVLSHPAYYIRWETTRKHKEQQVTIEVVVHTMEKLMMKAWINIINHSYIMVLDLWELEKASGKKKRRIRLVNTYDNSLKVDHVWNIVVRFTRLRAVADAEWNRILIGRNVLLCDINT